MVKIDESEEEVDEEEFASKDHHILVELFQALWYVVLSHTDFICYVMVFLNQVIPSILPIRAFENRSSLFRSTPPAFSHCHFL